MIKTQIMLAGSDSYKESHQLWEGSVESPGLFEIGTRVLLREGEENKEYLVTARMVNLGTSMENILVVYVLPTKQRPEK